MVVRLPSLLKETFEMTLERDSAIRRSGMLASEIIDDWLTSHFGDDPFGGKDSNIVVGEIELADLQTRIHRPCMFLYMAKKADKWSETH